MNSVVKEVSVENDSHTIEIRLEENLPPVPLDFILMQRSLMNLIMSGITPAFLNCSLLEGAFLCKG